MAVGVRTAYIAPMFFRHAFTLIALAGCLATGTPTPLPAGEAGAGSATRDIADAEISAVMELVMQARPRDALAYLDSLEASYSGQPLYLITRGRVLIELIPPDDDDKDYTKELSEPVLAVFEDAIDTCSERLDGDDADPRAHLYRGWSWMQKSHIHALGRSFYTAGRDAGKGKNDLEAYLAVDPEDPSANGLLGAFLYFTDAIPGVIKVLSKLLFLPTGDRDRGLEMLHRAVIERNPFSVDYTRLLNNVYVFFEGRYEEGLEGTSELVDRYPAYPRTVMALAIAEPFDPEASVRHGERVDRFLSLQATRDDTGLEDGAIEAVRAARAYSHRTMGRPGRAAEMFEAILEDAPERPDWVQGFARFQLGMLYADAGESERAREMFARVIDDERSDLYRDPAKKAREHLGKMKVAPGGRDVWEGRAAGIYSMNRDSLAAVARDLDPYILDSLPAAFFQAECYLLAGRYDRAAELYRDITRRVAPAWEYTWQMVSCTRLAEIAAAQGDYARAVDLQKQALEFYQKEYRVDWMLEGRRQYFERLANGENHAPAPTLLSALR